MFKMLIKLVPKERSALHQTSTWWDLGRVDVSKLIPASKEIVSRISESFS
ncbi:hypothetical protein TanjilG_14761 [Lupinus angustifolius]|uniref:Uncharacterized protein n=1 Tax=Lupinus angustifolius TaxID=3871 RepID=A0A1J7GX98_LUPAN|nr:hypothetical protein TanjilG_14761 [Lupinus angustifolius]